MAVDTATDTVWVANRGADSVSVIDGATNTLTGTLSFGGAGPYGGIAVDQTTDTVYVPLVTQYPNVGQIAVIDGDTGALVKSISTGSAWPDSVAVDQANGGVYATTVNNTVLVISTQSNTVTATVPVGSQPFSVAVDQASNTVYVGNYNVGTVSVISGTTNTVTATIGVGQYPEALDVDSTTHTVFVAASYLDQSNEEFYGEVSVIDGATNTVTVNVDVGQDLGGVAVDPSSGEMFVVNSESDTVSVLTPVEEVSPTITSAEAITFAGGVPQSFAVTATGIPAPTISEQGALPEGISFSNGVLSGTATTAGTFPIVLTASNGVSPDVTQDFTLSVPAITPSFTSPPTASFTTGEAGTFTPTTGGFPSPKVTEKGTLPAGVTFSDGTLSGTASHTGTYPIKLRAANGTNPKVSQAFTLVVAPAVGLNATSLLFAATGIGTETATQLVIATNNSAGALTFKAALSGAGASSYVVSGGTCKGSVMPAESCTIGVALLPRTGGPLAATLDVEADGLTIEPSVALSGIGEVSATYGAPVTLPVGSYPGAAAVDPLTDTAYVANQAANSVSVVDLATQSITNTITVGSLPSWVAVDPTAHTVYVANTGSDSVSLIDETTNTVSATVPLPYAPNAVAVDPTSHTAYVVSPGPGTTGYLSVIEGGSVVASVSAGLDPVSVAVDPARHEVFVGDAGVYPANGAVTVLTEYGNATLSTIGVSGLLTGIALDSDSGTLWAITQNWRDGSGPGSASAISEATNTVTTTVPVGDGPNGIAVDPALDQVYIADSSDNNVSVINDATSFVSSFPVGVETYAVAVDPATHSLALIDSNDDNLLVVAPVLTSATLLSASAHPVATKPVTLTADVVLRPAGGTVAFTANSKTLHKCGAVAVNTSTGTATCKATLSAGTYTFSASYSGDPTDQPSSATITAKVSS